MLQGAWSRRRFLENAARLGAAIGASACVSPPRNAHGDLGPLLPDPERLLDLPAGFEYVVLSRAGDTMDDGLLVPPRHDGMAAFPGRDGRTVLVRNHELVFGDAGAFGDEHELLARVDPELVYDRGTTIPCTGATTTVVYDARGKRVERQHLSLAGTLRNCSGGATPWGSWISCEESVDPAGETLLRDHGYAFEVDPAAGGPVRPVPLRAMGRFYREAIAVDPRSGCVYQTEDRGDGLVYRFSPDVEGDLAAGGRLQALAIADAPSLSTANHHELSNVPVGLSLDVRWIDLDDVESPADDLRHRGFSAGAARFSRGEGIAYGDGAVYWSCTDGGATRSGQIWRYAPSPHEGEDGEERRPGRLELFAEPDDSGTLDMCDNLTVAPWGDLVVCEDGPDPNHLVGVDPRGRITALARAVPSTELAGVCFSPDGTTMFANLQALGLTVAVSGPWPRRG